MADKLKIGDVVRLKSGGPAMTVISESDLFDDGCTVAWFDDSEEPREEDYPAEALVPHEDHNEE